MFSNMKHVSNKKFLNNIIGNVPFTGMNTF